jgi:hypothetical protein
VAKLVAGFQAASTVFADAKKNAAALSTTDATAFATAGKQIQTDLNRASGKITASFSGIGKLDKDNELSQALESAAACKSLTG